MLTITNGFSTLVVTKGAYNSMYAPQGWEITTDKITNEKDDFSVVSEDREIIPTEDENSNPGPAEDEIEDEEIEDDEEIDFSEIPLSEMSVPQLKMYGEQLGIEIDTDSAKTLRNRIKKALEG